MPPGWGGGGETSLGAWASCLPGKPFAPLQLGRSSWGFWIKGLLLGSALPSLSLSLSFHFTRGQGLGFAVGQCLATGWRWHLKTPGRG